jgi:hypothetical protein
VRFVGTTAMEPVILGLYVLYSLLVLALIGYCTHTKIKSSRQKEMASKFHVDHDNNGASIDSGEHTPPILTGLEMNGENADDLVFKRKKAASIAKRLVEGISTSSGSLSAQLMPVESHTI